MCVLLSLSLSLYPSLSISALFVFYQTVYSVLAHTLPHALFFYNMQPRGVVIGLPNFTTKDITGVCEACQFGKQHRHPFPKEWNVSKGILDVVHSHVWGPTQTTTFSGCHYYVTFIDDFSRNTWIYPMKQNNEVSGHFEKLKAEVKKALSRHVHCLQSGGGKEYFSNEFTACPQKEGI